MSLNPTNSLFLPENLEEFLLGDCQRYLRHNQITDTRSHALYLADQMNQVFQMVMAAQPPISPTLPLAQAEEILTMRLRQAEEAALKQVLGEIQTQEMELEDQETQEQPLMMGPWGAITADELDELMLEEMEAWEALERQEAETKENDPPDKSED